MNGSVKESDSAENMQTLAKGAKVAKGSEEYLGMHNDVSFLISNEMNPYEQQSTYNPNMPVRLLQYAGNLYEKYFKDNSLYKYGGRLLQLPVPKLVVFYNGKKEQPDEMILKLSDSFPSQFCYFSFSPSRKAFPTASPTTRYTLKEGSKMIGFSFPRSTFPSVRMLSSAWEATISPIR